jgi:hypothetical protein
LGDPGSVAPALERSHRAQLARPVGNADLDAFALAIAFGEGKGDPQPVFTLLEMGDFNPGELGPAKRDDIVLTNRD